MKVRDLMSRPVQTCRSNESLNAAAQKMWDEDIGAVAVVDDKNRVVGVVTDRDLCMAAYTQGRSGFPTESPWQTQQRRSISALGSVNGKYDGRSRVTVSAPNMDRAKCSSVPRRCAIVMPSSTTSPSTCMKTGVWVASSSSVR